MVQFDELQLVCIAGYYHFSFNYVPISGRYMSQKGSDMPCSF